jgi:hypothetical protein
MGRDHVGIGWGRRRGDDPCLGLARRLSWRHVLDRLAGLLGRRVALVPLVILHRAMDLHQDRFGGNES